MRAIVRGRAPVASSRSDRTPVKAPRAGGPARSPPSQRPRGLARHLEGWQPGLLAIFVAGVSSLLAVPRPVAPAEIPEPMLDPGALDRVARADRALAEAADHEPRDTDVAALGEAIRAYGRAETENVRPRLPAAGSDAGVAIVNARRDVARAATLAAAQGEGALARLRAYQLRSFLRELLRWETTGHETPELIEMGGPFLVDAEGRGWADEAGRRLVLDETVRAALFKKRWSELTLTRGPAFDLTTAETRAVYRFLLLHPPREARPGLARNGAAATTDDERAPPTSPTGIASGRSRSSARSTRATRPTSPRASSSTASAATPWRRTPSAATSTPTPTAPGRCAPRTTSTPRSTLLARRAGCPSSSLTRLGPREGNGVAFEGNGIALEGSAIAGESIGIAGRGIGIAGRGIGIAGGGSGIALERHRHRRGRQRHRLGRQRHRWGRQRHRRGRHRRRLGRQRHRLGRQRHRWGRQRHRLGRQRYRWGRQRHRLGRQRYRRGRQRYRRGRQRHRLGRQRDRWGRQRRRRGRQRRRRGRQWC